MAPSDFWDGEEVQAVFRFEKPGAEVRGKILFLEKEMFGEDDDKREVRVLTVSESGDIDDAQVIRLPRSLETLLMQVKPQIGEDIRIKFTSETPLRGPGDRKMMHWKVGYQGQTFSN